MHTTILYFAQYNNGLVLQAAPTTGLKDEDFTNAGKVNGVPVAELNCEDDDRPWRKPGADLSDYFNYGFNEETWFKYCDRQKAMRMNESGAGLGSLGINPKVFNLFVYILIIVY